MVEAVEPEPVEQIPTQTELAETTQLQCSTHVKMSPRGYTLSISGMRYSYYAVAQLVENEVLNPDAHMFMQEDFYQSKPNVVAAIMTQLSLKSGLKEWGDKAYTAAKSEMKQLHFWNTFEPMHWKELSETQRKTVLESHMFLKEKCDGKIKGRAVAGGNKQHNYISKEDASSPTVTTKSVLLTCIIDAQEERDVTVINIPNGFIQTHIKDENDMAIIKLCGILVDMLVKITPDGYKSYTMTDRKGVRQFVVQCKNALYSMMVASLLYYCKFTNSLTAIRFELNPYDP